MSTTTSKFLYTLIEELSAVIQAFYCCSLDITFIALKARPKAGYSKITKLQQFGMTEVIKGSSDGEMTHCCSFQLTIIKSAPAEAEFIHHHGGSHYHQRLAMVVSQCMHRRTAQQQPYL